MNSFSGLVASAFHLKRTENLYELPPGTRCTLTGEPITWGYPVQEIVSAAQGEWLETFNGNPYGYMSQHAAACWGASNPKGDMRCSKSFVVCGDIGYEPMVSQKSADEQGRPSWRDLVFTVREKHLGEPCAIVLSSDTKKRVWPRGRAGVIGSNTPVLIYDTGTLGMYEVRYIDWLAMLDDVTTVESIYNRGFYRRDIQQGLYQNLNACQTAGWEFVAMMETKLRIVRKTPHFPFALLIARWKDKRGEII